MTTPSTLIDLVKVQVTAITTGSFTLGGAVYGFDGIDALTDGDTYSYSVQQNGQYEAGTGIWVASTSSLTRAVAKSSNGNAAVPFSLASLELSFVALAQDFANAANSVVAAEVLAQVEANLAGAGGSAGIGFIQSGTGSVTRTAQDKLRDTVNVEDFGAKGDGATDDYAAVAAAIASLTTHGGDVYFAPLTYAIGTGLSIPQGVRLIGAGGMFFAQNMFSGSPGVTSTKIVALNSLSGNPVVSAPAGQGWGIENIALDGGGYAATVLKVVGAQFGFCKNLGIAGYTGTGLLLTSISNAGGGVADTLHNMFLNTVLFLPNISGAIALLITGASDGTTNACYNEFANLFINIASGSNAVKALVLQACDSNTISGIQFTGNAGSNVAQVTFDYSVVNVFPASNTLRGIDMGAASNAWTVTGTPHPTVARPNIVAEVGETNGMLWPTNVQNVACVMPNPAVSNPITGLTAAYPTTNVYLPWVAGTYRVSLICTVTTLSAAGGSITPTFYWDDDTGTTRSASAGSVAVAALNTNVISQVIRVGGSTLYPIQMQTVLTGSIAGAVYRLDVIVERLSA